MKEAHHHMTYKEYNSGYHLRRTCCTERTESGHPCCLWHTVTFHGHHSEYYLSSYWPGFCITVWKYSPQHPHRVLRRIFGAKKDEVTGEWSKLQIKQDYFPEDRNVKHFKAMKCNQHSATKSLPSTFRKSAESMTVWQYDSMTVFI